MNALHLQRHPFIFFLKKKRYSEKRGALAIAQKENTLTFILMVIKRGALAIAQKQKSQTVIAWDFGFIV